MRLASHRLFHKSSAGRMTMTSRILIFSAFLGMVATVPAFALEGRGAVKQSGATSRPTTVAPPTSPINAPKSPVVPLAEPYAILNTVSIFAVDHRSAEGRMKRTEQPALVRVTPPSAPVFRGVIIDDNGPLALMEVPDGNGGTSTEYLREGQTVSWSNSKVLSITLDKLRLSRTSVYGWQDSGVDIPIGFNLNGQQIGTLPLLPGAGMGDVFNRRGSRPNRAFGLGVVENVGNFGSAHVAIDSALPSGDAEDLETRMIQRRQNQLRAVVRPEGSSTAAPTKG
jgi:hypothetical protein